MESERPYDALIIGAGIGGLSAGIILSRLGLRVAVIEKNPLPGGMMRGYRRGGMDCPVGVHYFGSFGEGEPLRRICDFLGVTERMAVERMGQGSPIDRYLFDDFTFDLPEGVDAFAASLRQAFPDDRQPIARIIDNLRATLDVQNSFAFFSPAPPLLDSKLYAPLGEYLAGMNCSAGLRSVLGVAARWMGMSESDCPVFYHHFALASYLLSSWRLRGTGAELAEAFVSRFEELGGTLICGDAVTAILPSGAAVGGVRLASGRVLGGSRLVAAIHPKKVIGMLPEGAVKPRHARLVGELAETEGLFALSAAVDAADPPGPALQPLPAACGPGGGGQGRGVLSAPRRPGGEKSPRDHYEEPLSRVEPLGGYAIGLARRGLCGGKGRPGRAASPGSRGDLRASGRRKGPRCLHAAQPAGLGGLSGWLPLRDHAIDAPAAGSGRALPPGAGGTVLRRSECLVAGGPGNASGLTAGGQAGARSRALCLGGLRGAHAGPGKAGSEL